MPLIYLYLSSLSRRGHKKRHASPGVPSHGMRRWFKAAHFMGEAAALRPARPGRGADRPSAAANKTPRKVRGIAPPLPTRPIANSLLRFYSLRYQLSIPCCTAEI